MIIVKIHTFRNERITCPPLYFDLSIFFNLPGPALPFLVGASLTVTLFLLIADATGFLILGAIFHDFQHKVLI